MINGSDKAADSISVWFGKKRVKPQGIIFSTYQLVLPFYVKYILNEHALVCTRESMAFPLLYPFHDHGMCMISIKSQTMFVSSCLIKSRTPQISLYFYLYIRR